MDAQPDQESDAQAIRRSLEDGSAFTLIFDRHYATVHRFLVAHWGPEVGADLAAETFLVAFDQRARFDVRRDSARPWLFGIALNLGRMEARRRHREAAALGRHAQAESSDDFVEGVVRRLDAQQRAARVGLVDALRQLRADDLIVLTMSALGEMTHAQIADSLKIPIGTVKSRMHRTVTVLRALLEPEWESGGGSSEASDEA